MKKLIDILIFLLALLLMCILSSCRSPKTVTKLTTSTDSVKVTLKDSSNQRFEFLFDKLDYWLTQYPDSLVLSNDTSPKNSRLVKHLIISNGKLTYDNTQLASQDSVHNKSSTQKQQTETKSHHTSIIPTIILLILSLSIILIVFYRIHKSRLS